MNKYLKFFAPVILSIYFCAGVVSPVWGEVVGDIDYSVDILDSASNVATPPTAGRDFKAVITASSKGHAVDSVEFIEGGSINKISQYTDESLSVFGMKKYYFVLNTQTTGQYSLDFNIKNAGSFFHINKDIYVQSKIENEDFLPSLSSASTLVVIGVVAVVIVAVAVLLNSVGSTK